MGACTRMPTLGGNDGRCAMESAGSKVVIVGGGVAALEAAS